MICLLGVANHLGKFIPNLADSTKSLRELLSKKSYWTWEESQQSAFAKLKEDPNSSHLQSHTETIGSTDVSSYGLGAVLFQVLSDGNSRPVAYASRAHKRDMPRSRKSPQQ